MPIPLSQNSAALDLTKFTPEEMSQIETIRQQINLDDSQAIVTYGALPRQVSRTAIPDDLKQLVWLRDGGRCRSCGSTTELQFDHIIPLSMGGATSAENLQILCGPCNRRKGAGLTIR